MPTTSLPQPLSEARLQALQQIADTSESPNQLARALSEALAECRRLSTESSSTRPVMAWLGGKVTLKEWDSNGYGTWRCAHCRGWGGRDPQAIEHTDWCMVPKVEAALAALSTSPSDSPAEEADHA